jgi:hypothetical protein
MLIPNMRDIECIEKALTQLKTNYVIEGKDLVLNNGRLINKGSGYELEYIENRVLPFGSIDIHSFVQKLRKTYEQLLEEKIAKIRLEESKLKAKQIADQFTEEEKRKEEARLKLEKARLEDIIRKEREEKKKKVQEAENKIKENALKSNYQVKEEIQGTKKVLVLVKRS